MKKPLKEMLEKIGGKHLLNEAPGKLIVGFSKEMGALYVSRGSGKSIELRKADIEQIIKQYKKFKSKLD